MSSVYFPAQIAQVFKRIVNVISTFSLSQQYVLKHQAHSQATAVTESEHVSVDGGGDTVGFSSGRSSYNDPKKQPQEEKEEERRFEPFSSSSSGQGPRDIIHQLLVSPALYDPLRVPRYPIVLCHGLYGFDTRGPSSFPSMRMHYWYNVLRVLRDKMKAQVIVTSVPGTGSVASRAESLDRQLREKALGRGVNFLAHSMGGLDCRYLISHVKPEDYVPLSLTTVCTPHRGSPFMDWCSEYLGLGKLTREEKELVAKASGKINGLPSESSPSTTTTSSSSSQRSPISLTSLPSSFTTLLLSILDSPAYANLTSSYLNDVFNPATPDDPRVKYFSVAGRTQGVNIWHPFWLPKMVLDDVETKERRRVKEVWERQREREREWGYFGGGGGGSDENKPIWARDEEWGNDGLVTVQSAKWGEFLGVMEGCDHWEMRGARGIEFGVDLPAIPAIRLGSSSHPSSSSSTTTTPPSSSSSTSAEDGWGLGGLGGLKDLGWFLRAWKKEEKIQEEAMRKAPGTLDDSSTSSPSSLSSSSSSSSPSTRGSQHRQKAREMNRERDDAVIKASTDKLSAVFDWITEKVPVSVPISVGHGNESGKDHEPEEGRGDSIREAGMRMVVTGVAGDLGSENAKTKTMQTMQGVGAGSRSGEGKKSKNVKSVNELGTKEDLERFYVALARKLYDEGL